MNQAWKAWFAASLAVMLAGLALPAAAKKELAKPAPSQSAAAAGQTSVTGPVKGPVTGKTFVIARKGGTVTVDAGKATVRQAGRFAKLDTVRPGTMVTAKGSMSGTTLTATDVTVYPRKGAMKMSPRSAKPGTGAAAAPPK